MRHGIPDDVLAQRLARLPRGKVYSLRELAPVFGVSTSRISQLETSALRKLRKHPILQQYYRELREE